MSDHPTQDKFEFVKKFSYRDYQGDRTNRVSRVFSLAFFEMINTWRKSTIGKILLAFIVFINIFVVVLLGVPSLGNVTNSLAVQTVLNSAVHYVSMTPEIPILPSTSQAATFSPGIGILIIALLSIAGSGFFADDKQGKVIEIYLSRMRRIDYAIGKFLGMFLYCNVFVTLPILIVSIWYIQGFGLNQLDFIGLYVSLVVSGAMISSLFTIVILLLSSLVDKRAYASLTFFIGYFLFDSLARVLYISNSSDNMYLLIVPSYLLVLLIYVIAGNMNLGIRPIGEGRISTGQISALSLNNGIGLQWWHVLVVVFVVLAIGLILLLYKIHKMTTNEL